jgi:hypothetical protein
MSKKEKKKLEKILDAIVVVAIIAAFLGIPQWITDWVIQWLISAFIGTLFSLVAASLVEAFTNDFLKTISLTVEVKNYKFSITLFAIATLLVKFGLFHSI